MGQRGAAVLAAICAAVLAGGAAAAQPVQGDATRGKAVYSRCAFCHAVEGSSDAGPSLVGVVGRKAGTAPGFRSSKALAASGVVWDDQSLDRYLEAPSKAVPGTTMLVGMPSAQDRADVIAYLKILPASP